jgi:superfamily I DNA/RNA helicase
MFPSKIDPDTKSPAERLLYEALQVGLDDGYTVFHSVAWQALNGEGRVRDGETDFIVAHPRRGLLVLEAKGGIIRFDGRSRQWTSVSRRDGRNHPIVDPFEQARNSKYALRDLIDRMPGAVGKSVNIGYAVAFPDVSVGSEYLGPDKRKEIILDQSDLGDLAGWVARCLAHYRGMATQAETAPDQAAIDFLIETLGRSWELKPRMWGEFLAEEKVFIRLTEGQYRVLDFLNRQRRAAICGCAGSGKTLVAVEKATRLAKGGLRTLFTCFNKALAHDLRLKLGSIENLQIINFHDLCAQLAEKAGNLPELVREEEFYDRLLPEALVPAAEKLGVRYDAIVVDEGQDFQDHWWIPLQFLLEEPDDGILYIFYDDNQRIYVPKGDFPVRTPPFSLTVNCRNTQAIHRVVNRFYKSSDRPTALGPAGRPVEVISYKNRPEMLAHVQRVLAHFSEEGIPAEEIVVLAMIGKHADFFHQAGLAREWPPGPGDVYCTTIHAFKGLERSTVILAGIDSWMLDRRSHLDQLLYVGSSRARHHLVVILSEHSAEVLRKYFQDPQ